MDRAPLASEPATGHGFWPTCVIMTSHVEKSSVVCFHLFNKHRYHKSSLITINDAFLQDLHVCTIERNIFFRSWFVVATVHISHIMMTQWHLVYFTLQQKETAVARHVHVRTQIITHDVTTIVNFSLWLRHKLLHYKCMHVFSLK